MTSPDENLIRIEIAGKIRELDLDEIGQLDVVRTDQAAWHLLDRGASHTIALLALDPQTRTALFRINGENREARLVTGLDVLIDQMGMNRGMTRKISALHAPMPGLVKGILVRPGDHVEKGAPLLILEAMKMENVMTAPEAVTIRQIDVQLSQPVEKGARLIEFDTE